MNDDGYTLGECLVALFILSLAIGGLTSGLAMVNRQQSVAVRLTARDHALRAVHEGLDALLDGQGPFIAPSEQPLSGSSTGFRFDCGPAHADCRAWLVPSSRGLALHVNALGIERSYPLPSVRSAQFVYTGTRTVGPIWPPGLQGREPLKAVGILAQTANGPLPIVSVPIWVDQPISCDFDAILKDCRS